MAIHIILSNKKIKNYDLTDKSDITAFKQLVTKAINNDDTTRLTTLKSQLQAIANKSILEQEQLAKILLTCPDVPTRQIVIAPQPIGMLQLQHYPMAPVIAPALAISAESGEVSFQGLYAHLMQDMLLYTGNIQHLTMYSALVINMFMHAATFSPLDGHGKAQLREFNHKSQLQYYRSQGNHAHGSFFKALTKTPGDTRACRLPFNSGFIKLIGPTNFNANICSEIKKIHPDSGYAKSPTATVNGYVMTQVAHAGARKNNFSTLIKGMEVVVAGLANPEAQRRLKEKLNLILKPTQTIIALRPDECTRRIHAVFGNFNQLQATCSAQLSVDQHLASNLLSYRINRVKALTQKIVLANFTQIAIETDHQNLTCLMIRLYPTCHTADDTYKEGVTNVLLSFFGALLNHHAQGLRLHTERRQSFGFFRPTLTDAGCLILRLSLGLEPTTFDTLILKSLTDLDTLLGQFRFDQPAHLSVNPVFERTTIKVAEVGKRKPRESDTYLRNSVRKDDRTLNTYRQASAYIQQAALTSPPHQYLQTAMSNFLTQYIRQDIHLPLTPTILPAAADIVQTIASPVINLLQNTLAYAFDFMAALTFLANNEPLAAFGHVYYHSLLKLFNCCQEAQSLLANITTTPASKFYSTALLLTETMLEYLISLAGLQQIRSELLGSARDPITQLRNTELAYASSALAIPTNRLQLFFTDSGQQAITTTLLTLSLMLHGPAADGRSYDSDIHLFGKSYFEVAEFVKDCKKDHVSLEMPDLNKAKIVFVDISQLDQLDLTQCIAMHALVIDTTHHPLFDQALLKQVLQAAHQKDAWVTLVDSALKHQQLGLDKYQTGKIITLAPIGKSLGREAIDIFETVSREAMHPAVATYLLMVNAICREKIASVQPLAAPSPQPQGHLSATQTLINRGAHLVTRPIVAALESKAGCA